MKLLYNLTDIMPYLCPDTDILIVPGKFDLFLNDVSRMPFLFHDLQELRICAHFLCNLLVSEKSSELV